MLFSPPLTFSLMGVCLLACWAGVLWGRGTFTAVLAAMGEAAQRIFTLGAPALGIVLIMMGAVMLPHIPEALRMTLSYAFLGCLGILLVAAAWLCVPRLPLPHWIRLTPEDIDRRSRIELFTQKVVVHGTRPWGVFAMGCLATVLSVLFHLDGTPQFTVLTWPFAAAGFLISARGMVTPAGAELTADGITISDGIRRREFAWGQVLDVQSGPLHLEFTTTGRAGGRPVRFSCGALGITTHRLEHIIGQFHPRISAHD